GWKLSGWLPWDTALNAEPLFWVAPSLCHGRRKNSATALVLDCSFVLLNCCRHRRAFQVISPLSVRMLNAILWRCPVRWHEMKRRDVPSMVIGPSPSADVAVRQMLDHFWFCRPVVVPCHEQNWVNASLVPTLRGSQRSQTFTPR